MEASPPESFAKEIDTALGALLQATKLSQLIVLSQDKGTITKDDLSPVTIADFAVQALLIASFKEAFPNDTFVGEEDATELRSNDALMTRVWDLLNTIAQDEYTLQGACKLPHSKEHMCDLIDQAGSSSPGGPGTGRVWVFDPIDGTKTFVRGQMYAINIGLIVDGKQTFGAQGCPNLTLSHKGHLRNESADPNGYGCLLFAIKDHGAYYRYLDKRHKELKSTIFQIPPNFAGNHPGFITCTGLVDSALDGVHDVVAQRLGFEYPGSDVVPWVVRWAALALSIGSVTVWVYKRRDRYAKVWDHAGAILLFEETGGKVTDVHGKEIDFSAGRKLSNNFGFVAAPAATHAKVLGIVQDVLKEQGKEEFLQ
ncbi:carbohydrate phosphatase [Trichoderma austrokoningii]